MPVRLIALKKKYVSPDGTQVPVIDIEQFELGDGEQVALVGSSGSGKTTLLHLIAGILTPDSGSVVFAGSGAPAIASLTAASDDSIPYRPVPVSGSYDGTVDLTRLTEANRDVFRGRNIGYIFQTHHLLPGFTALENVELGMTFTGRQRDSAWANHLLRQVGLAERLNYRPGKLSVGQQQRVAIARALANRPRLVLADEPTGSLDSVSAQQALDLIRKLCNEVGASLLLVSHDPAITKQLPRAVVLAELNRAAMGHVPTAA